MGAKSLPIKEKARQTKRQRLLFCKNKYTDRKNNKNSLNTFKVKIVKVKGVQKNNYI